MELSISNNKVEKAKATTIQLSVAGSISNHIQLTTLPESDEIF